MAKTPKNREPHQMNYTSNKKPDTQEQLHSQVVIDPAAQAAMTLSGMVNKESPLDVNESLELARQNARKASEGDLSGLEQMLVSQATTLDVLFNNMVRKGDNAEYLNKFEAYTKLALRAQSQCRNTITAVAEIKNPKGVFVSGQANISSGHQQVNNSADKAARAGQNSETAEQTITGDSDGVHKDD